MDEPRKSAVRGVAEIVLNGHDIQRMRRFYEEVVGFRFHSQFPESDPTIIFLIIKEEATPLSRGGHPQLFALIDPKRHVHTRDTFQGLDHKRSSLNHLAFEIDPADYAPEKERLESAGVKIQTAVFPHMQARALFFNDPEGNLLELICHDPSVSSNPLIA